MVRSTAKLRGAEPVPGESNRAEASPVGLRFRSARRYIDGAIRMVEDDRYCIDVLRQLAAVQGSLGRVSRDILES